MTVELGILLAVIGCFVGLAGWLAGRDKKISNDSEWRGTVNTKLDDIRTDIGNVSGEFKGIKTVITDHEKRLTVVEESNKSAHKRIDEIGGHK